MSDGGNMIRKVLDFDSPFDRGFAALFAEKFHFSDRLLGFHRGSAAAFCGLLTEAILPRRNAFPFGEEKPQRN